jgi:ATP-dependent DNA ligase
MIRLECTTGGHNKFYEFHLLRSTGRFTAKGLYGAIGQAPREAVIYDGDNEQEAVGEMQKKQLEKQKKGYIIVGSNGDQPPPPAQTKTDLPVIWPMNAQGVKDEAHLQSLLNDSQYMAQEKLDGMRAIVHVTKEGLRIFSRSAGVKDPTRPLEKTTSLPHLASLIFPGLAGTILDGEILAPGVDSATLSGALHRTNGGNGNHSVKLFVFDILKHAQTDLADLTLEKRLTWLVVLKRQLYSEHIQFLSWAASSSEKSELYYSIRANGGEGIMLKRLNEYYMQGGRPANNWYKARKSASFDCVVMDFTRGKGKYNNQIGAVIFGQYVNGKLTELGQASGMDDTVRAQMTKHPADFIGRIVVIEGMERLKSGAIRHPRYVTIRHDKSPLECKWYQGEQ